MAEKENKIQLDIIKHLQANGVFCWRNGNHAVWDAKNNIYRSNPYSICGAPDIIAIIKGQFTGIECKTKTGKISADQILFKKRCERHGGKYIVARCTKDVDNLLT